MAAYSARCSEAEEPSPATPIRIGLDELSSHAAWLVSAATRTDSVYWETAALDSE
jgi:hypothetical protein